MAASVNNIAATFASARFFPPSSPAATSAQPASAVSPAATSAPLSIRPISASWNPHSALPRSRRSDLLTLYGPPGPTRQPFFPRRAPPPPTPLVSPGSRLPAVPLSYLDTSSSAVRSTSLPDLANGRKAVVMAVPAAFAPAPCPTRWWAPSSTPSSILSAESLVRRAPEIRDRGGAAVVACVAVNDVYVMRAWGDHLGAAEAGVVMLSDPNAELASAMGMALDLRGGVEGFGVRSEGYCMVAANGVVRALFLNGGEDGAAAGIDDVIRAL